MKVKKIKHRYVCKKEGFRYRIYFKFEYKRNTYGDCFRFTYIHDKYIALMAKHRIMDNLKLYDRK